MFWYFQVVVGSMDLERCGELGKRQCSCCSDAVQNCGDDSAWNNMFSPPPAGRPPQAEPTVVLSMIFRHVGPGAPFEELLDFAHKVSHLAELSVFRGFVAQEEQEKKKEEEEEEEEEGLVMFSRIGCVCFRRLATRWDFGFLHQLSSTYGRSSSSHSWRPSVQLFSVVFFLGLDDTR